MFGAGEAEMGVAGSLPMEVTMRMFLKAFLLGASIFSVLPALAQDQLRQGFAAPPAAAKPRVWWHWINGNVTKDGIAKDLAWMHRIGIGGVTAIDVSLFPTQVVKDRLAYMSPEWKDAFAYSAQLATKYDMELSIDSSPGWSETGGPWVAPDQAMKKLVWSRTAVKGGTPFHGLLAPPPAVTGPIQNVPAEAGLGSPSKAVPASFYRDSLVIAYPTPVPSPRAAAVTSSSGAVDGARLVDGDLTGGTVLPAQQGEAWIAFDYAKPVQIQGATLAASVEGAAGLIARLEASDDGKTWRALGTFPALKLVETTLATAPVSARHFRVVFTAAPPSPNPGIFSNPAPGAMPFDLSIFNANLRKPLAFRVHELALHAQATVNAFEAKAGFAIAPDNYALTSAAPVAAGTAIAPGSVVVLTDKMQPDGRLDWTPPPGDWTVLRLGYSLEGKTNHPAPAEATGLEVDKLNAAHVRAYLEHYLGTYRTIGPFGPNGVRALTVDSTEIGAQNWSEAILAEFRSLRGYDPTPWLPALTGVVVGSAEQSDRFLWDFRTTINELLARNHYGEIAAVAHANGLVNYGEALEDHRPTFGDDMAMRQYTDVPMAAMWTYGTRQDPFDTYVADIRGAASVAHIYGQNLVAAESMTSAAQPWAFSPRSLKRVVDLEFATGVNRIVVHTSVHQPIDTVPGLSLFVFGQYFNRLESWADQAGAWVDYLARCSFLLQQGRHAADIAYFYGEEAPLTGLFGDKTVDLPPGYGFDFVNADIVKTKLSVDKGDLATQTGMRYRILYLGGSSQRMTLATLRRIADLVRDGAVVVGRRPASSPSLADDPAAFEALADAVFGTGVVVRSVGAGTVYPSGSLGEALAALKLAPDFAYDKPKADTELLSIHRHLSDGELYFVSNRHDRSESVTATFRVSGRVPELWDAVSGKTSKAAYTTSNGRTAVQLALPPYGSTFVIFRKPAAAPSAKPPLVKETRLATLRDWTVRFTPGRGAPAQAKLKTLASWSDNADPGIKYFSGTGSYSKSFDLPVKPAGRRLLLDLGEVGDIASVEINGKAIGTVWTPPYRLDITDAVHQGGNKLVIKVSNLWVNRLIGDLQPGATKITTTTLPTYKPDAPLRPSGLLGPVAIIAQ